MRGEGRILDFPVGLFEGKAGGEGEGVGYEIDLWDNVELWFPVEGEIKGGVLEFVVQAYDAGGPEESLVALDMIGIGNGFEAQVATCTIEPGERRGAANKLMFFIQGAYPKPVAK